MSCLLLFFLAFAQINDTITDTIIVNERIFNDSIDTSILDDSLILDSINPELPDSIQADDMFQFVCIHFCVVFLSK